MPPPLVVGPELAQAGQAVFQAAPVMRRPLAVAAPRMPQAAWAVQAVLPAARRLVLAARQYPTLARRMRPRSGQPTLCQIPKP
jgi:hypothetical protein